MKTNFSSKPFKTVYQGPRLEIPEEEKNSKQTCDTASLNRNQNFSVLTFQLLHFGKVLFSIKDPAAYTLQNAQKTCLKRQIQSVVNILHCIRT